jgi:hypothetical protein
MKSSVLNILKWIGLVLLVLIVALGLLLAYWYLRPNASAVAPSLAMDTWDAVKDGSHNSNTDMIYWQDAFYLIYASSPYHFGTSQSRLILLRSTDARQWAKQAEFNASGEDIRDPKLAVIGGRLFLYALKNVDFTAEPFMTVYSSSDDGVRWQPFQDIQPAGWLFWRPKTADGKTWYVPAYWHEHGKSALLKSTDGMNWSIVSQIYEGDRNDETAIEFLPDGRMLATARLEASDDWFGDNRGATLIALAAPPFTQWTTTKSKVTRLDGPCLFSYHDRIYAVGRYEPGYGGLLAQMGSILNRKRTALFLVEKDRLVHLSDLPSAGDTSYEGLVMRGDTATISYYTSDIARDWPWIMGMARPSEIRMAEVNLPSLEALVKAQ